MQKELLILGNGRTLADYDFTKFSIDTLGMNNAYRYWHKKKWYPTYYACLDKEANKNFAKDIYYLITNRKQYGIKSFLLRRSILEMKPELEQLDDVLFWEDIFKSKDKFTTGSGSLIWALRAGFTTVYILGIDCNYKTSRFNDFHYGATNNNTKIDNSDYFFDDYKLYSDPKHISTRSNNSRNKAHLNDYLNIKQSKDIKGKTVIVCDKRSELYKANIFKYKKLPTICTE